jgi:5-methylcytosine-specific restriction endonuclease McrA
MPMERSRYPDNWEAIALQVKESANWVCQNCGRQCRKPGESLYEFIDRIVGGNWRDNCELCSQIGDHSQRWTLTVAHLDQNPSNNAPSNLKALCSGCHLKHDAPFRKANAYAKRERKGQLTILAIGECDDRRKS